MKKYMNKRIYIIFTIIIIIILLTTLINFGFFYKVEPKKEITPTDGSIQVQPKLNSNTSNSISELELAKPPKYKNKYIQIVDGYQNICKDFVSSDSISYGNKIIVVGKYYDPVYIVKENNGNYLMLTDCYEVSIGIGYIYNNGDDFENYYQGFFK